MIAIRLTAMHINRQIKFSRHLQLRLKEVFLVFPGMRMGIIIQTDLSHHICPAFNDLLSYLDQPFRIMILQVLGMDGTGQLKRRMFFLQLFSDIKIMPAAADDDGFGNIRFQHPFDHLISVFIKLS